MENLVFIAGIIIFVVFIFGLDWNRARIARREYAKKLLERYGEHVEKTYSTERYERIPRYFERHRDRGAIDDITWNDLSLDTIFRRMDDTLSAAGEEYLYHTLRTPKKSLQELAHLEDIVGFFVSHPKERLALQLALSDLGSTGKFSIYDYLDHLDLLGQRNNKKNLLFDLLFLPLLGFIWVDYRIAVAGLVILVIYQIMTYFKEKKEIDPYIVSFAYVIRLLETCDRIEKLSLPICEAELRQMKEARISMESMRRNSYWVMAADRGNASGNVLSVLLDYIRMIFHVDLIKFNTMLQHVRTHATEIDTLIGLIGSFDAAISIGGFRLSLKHGWCVPEFSSKKEISMQEGYHPLLTEPVKNSIHAEGGVLITGSNASGKSTFLKTLAINSIFAQTIHTCTAGEFRTAFFDLYTSMALRDNLSGGESYYIVEIKALKRILEAAKNPEYPILCCVDEVLRGTNTVERIAASTQILKSLRQKGVHCFAATHDIELTELLDDLYENYHFEGQVEDGDVTFDYRICKGKATTRNAIKLLEVIGYDADIVEKANAHAKRFVETGSWGSV